VLIVLAAAAAAAAPLGARIAPPKLLVLGLGLVAAGLALYPTVGAHSSWVAYEPGLLPASAGTGLLDPIQAGLPINAVPAAMAGLASASTHPHTLLSPRLRRLWP
jgi:hypothetical protein